MTEVEKQNDWEGVIEWQNKKVNEWFESIKVYITETKMALDKTVQEKKELAEKGISLQDDSFTNELKDIDKKYQDTIKKSEALYAQSQLIIGNLGIEDEKDQDTMKRSEALYAQTQQIVGNVGIEDEKVQAATVIQNPDYLFYKIEYEIEKYKSYKNLSFKDKIKKFFGFKYGNEQKIAELVKNLQGLADFYKKECKKETESATENNQRRIKEKEKQFKEEKNREIETEVNKHFGEIKDIVLNIGGRNGRK